MRQLRIRRATTDDARLLFRWANDPAVREAAFNSDPIEWDDHLSWLEGKLRSEESVILILEMDAVPVGQIRFDREASSDVWTIDYSVDREFRGMSLGKEIVSQGVEYLVRQMGKVRFSAEVKKSNVPSIKVFEFNGFVLESVQSHSVRFARTDGENSF
mgnify:FL=1